MAKRKSGRKRKPSAFARCIGRTLKGKKYTSKTQWRSEFKKAVRKCKA